MKWLYPPGSVCSTPDCGRPPRALGMCEKCFASWRWRTSERERRAFKAWWMRTRPVRTKKEKRAYNTAYVRIVRARKRAEKAAQAGCSLTGQGATEAATYQNCLCKSNSPDMARG